MVTTAIRARTNSRGDKSTLLGDAGKGAGSKLRRTEGAFSMVERRESSQTLFLFFLCFAFSCFFVLYLKQLYAEDY